MNFPNSSGSQAVLFTQHVGDNWQHDDNVELVSRTVQDMLTANMDYVCKDKDPNHIGGAVYKKAILRASFVDAALIPWSANSAV